MDCPVCKDVQLAMTDRQGIEIDYCPQCRGVWLDRGELDKLIERSSVEAAPARQPPPATPPPRQHGYPSYPPSHDDYYRRKKKKNLLGELFDF
jgi:Zn-finger nucleic acid-binding protein